MGLNLSNKEVKRALEQTELQGKKPIGRGRYSLVYDNAETVLKLTVDRGAVDLREHLANACLTLHTLPKVHAVTRVGEYEGRPLWLLDIEKLNKLTAGTPQRKLAMAIQRFQRGINGGAIKESFVRVAELTCRHMALVDELAPEWRDTFSTLAEYAAGRHHLGCDFHPGNFLTRPATGELVLTDPFHDRTH